MLFLHVVVAAALLGSVPVTINWQADTEDTVVFKAESVRAQVVVVDRGTPTKALTRLKQHNSMRVIDVSEIHNMASPTLEDIARMLDSGPPSDEDTRCVIFTSGSTGRPKGVMLSYTNYAANQQALESLLNLEERPCSLEVVVVNPLHHTNSTSMSDLAIRRSDSVIHLFEKYSSRFWQKLHNIVTRRIRPSTSQHDRVVVTPLVSRHIDLLHSLIETNNPAALGITPQELQTSLANTVLLLGSAPVGPTTVDRVRTLTAGRLPIIRFGATETTLQVCGTSMTADPEHNLSAFYKGWSHSPGNDFIVIPCSFTHRTYLLL
jgi:acyl-CoA synthetase (AMP-forming)/AMP-acid ligase II